MVAPAFIRCDHRSFLLRTLVAASAFRCAPIKSSFGGSRRNSLAAELTASDLRHRARQCLLAYARISLTLSTMPIVHLDKVPVRQIFPGLRAKLIHSDHVSHSWVEVDAGATFPEHQHPHEQIVSVLSGELDLVVDGVAHTLTPGVVFVIPPNVPHSGGSKTGCHVLDAFAPVRDDYR